MTAIPAVPEFQRQRLVTALLAAPLVVAALAVCGMEVWRVAAPRSPLFTTPFTYSLADAIAAGDVEQAHAYIRAGHDPNQPIAVRDPTLTGGQWVLVSPLLWAVATGHSPIVKMLLGHGARVGGPVAAQAICLAEALDRQDIRRALLMLTPEVPPNACAGLAAGETPLLHVADEG